MKTIMKLIYLFFFFLAFSSYGQQQMTQVTYKKKMAVDIKSQSSNPDAVAIIEKTNAQMENIKYILTFNNSESYFKMIEGLDSDKDKNNLSLTMAKLIGIGNGSFYTNKNTGSILHQKQLSSDLFLINSNVSDKKWKLSKENKKIGKYNAYKATTTTSEETVRGAKERNIVVWYTTDIPVSFGPADFSGLPGLILELNIGNISVYAEEILEIKTDKIEIPKKGIKVTQQEFNDIQKKGFAKYKN